MTPALHITNELGRVAGDVLAAWIRQVLTTRSTCRLAVPGGSTPGPVFERLVQVLSVDELKAIVLGFVDERHVAWDGTAPPPGDSNLRIAVDTGFADRVSRVVPLLHAGLDLATAAERANAEVTALGGFDLILLGAGPDGHVASVFPDHPSSAAAKATDRAVFAVRDSPKPPPERLSLTLPWLVDVEHTVFVAKGASKAPALRRAWDGDPDLPLTHAAPRGGWTWVIDPAAAADLPTEPS